VTFQPPLFFSIGYNKGTSNLLLKGIVPNDLDLTDIILFMFQGNMATITPDIAARYGLSMNQQNGIYKPGVSYGIEKKLEVAGVYQRHEEENQGTRRQFQRDAVAHVANQILSGITHSNILGFYAKKNLIQLVGE
jgi:hypothetical protein